MPTGSRYKGPTVDEVKASIAAWIRDYLDEPGHRQVDLANDMGVSEATISNIRSGTLKPGFKTLVRLHFGVGVTLSEVVRWRPRTTPQTKALARK